MTTLIITLPPELPTAATPCEGVLTGDGLSVLSRVETTVSLLPSASGGEIVAVVPVSRLSWHRVELPQGAISRSLFQEGGTGRLRSVLDGLLEERVLDETAQLHFALEPQARSGASAWVAACNRAWLHAWLAELEHAGRAVSRIVPELAPTRAAGPDMSATASLHVMGTPEKAQLVMAGPDGVTLLPLSQASAALVAWPEGLQPVAEPAVAALAEDCFKMPVLLQTPAQRWLAAAQSDWDLAQFDLLYNRRARTQKRLSALGSALLQAPRWRAARWAALLLLVVNIGGLQAWAMKERSAQAAKRAAISGTLTATFPEVRVVVDAPLQMARSVAELQRRNGAASAADMETMLGQLQAVATDLPTPKAIEFVANELKLKGLDLAAPGLDNISTRLRAQGYSARLDGDSLTIREERQP
ncbi:MAG: type II secretion system protein GspL [Polaromonas sp.]